MAEWLKVLAWKASVLLIKVPGVRIPLTPHLELTVLMLN